MAAAGSRGAVGWGLGRPTLLEWGPPRVTLAGGKGRPRVCRDPRMLKVPLPRRRERESELHCCGRKGSAFPGGSSSAPTSPSGHRSVCPPPSPASARSPGRRDFWGEVLPLQSGEGGPFAARAAKHFGGFGRVGLGAGSCGRFRLLESVVLCLFDKERRIPASFLGLNDSMEGAHAGGTKVPRAWRGGGPRNGRTLPPFPEARPPTPAIPVPPGQGRRSR